MPKVSPPQRRGLSSAPWLAARVVAALVLLTASVLAALWLGFALAHGDPLSRPHALLTAALAVVLVLGGLAGLVRGLERRSLGETLGLATPSVAARAFALGLAAWMVPAAVAVAVAVAAGWARVEVGLHWPQALLFLVLHFLVVLLMEAVTEELALRGYVGAVLAERFSRWPAIGLQALLFAGLAVLLTGRANVLDVSLFLAMGVVFGYLRELTGTVWTSVGFHAAFQTGMQLLVAGQRGVFSLEAGGMLPFVLLGMVPFAACIALVELAIAAGWLRRGSGNDAEDVSHNKQKGITS